jgi:hypothetical protein
MLTTISVQMPMIWTVFNVPCAACQEFQYLLTFPSTSWTPPTPTKTLGNDAYAIPDSKRCFVGHLIVRVNRCLEMGRKRERCCLVQCCCCSNARVATSCIPVRTRALATTQLSRSRCVWVAACRRASSTASHNTCSQVGDVGF